jgi:proteic killer suppression protein
LQPSTEVSLSKFAEKQLKRIPKHIAEAFYYWVETVKLIGILEVRKFRSGYRSIRLNRAYRAIYVETKEGLEIQVIEVNKHEY